MNKRDNNKFTIPSLKLMSKNPSVDHIFFFSSHRATWGSSKNMTSFGRLKMRKKMKRFTLVIRYTTCGHYHKIKILRMRLFTFNPEDLELSFSLAKNKNSRNFSNFLMKLFDFIWKLRNQQKNMFANNNFKNKQTNKMNSNTNKNNKSKNNNNLGAVCLHH